MNTRDHSERIKIEDLVASVNSVQEPHPKIGTLEIIPLLNCEIEALEVQLKKHSYKYTTPNI